jgi:molecular chaperone IbpA
MPNPYNYNQLQERLHEAIRGAAKDPFALLDRVSIGFEDLFADADSLGQVDLRFPFHNIVKAGENDYRLQITLAGWSRDEIKVQVEEKKITIIGVVNQVKDGKVIHQGITKKPFKRHFVVRPGLIVTEAWMADGLLTIQLVKPTPVSTMREIPLTNAQSTFTGGTMAEEGEPKTVNLSEVPEGHELLTEDLGDRG